MNPRVALLEERISTSYARQWIIFFVLLAVGAFTYWMHTYVQRPHEVTAPASTPNAEWFFMLRMPEAQVLQDRQHTRDLFTKWIDAMLGAGFHPALLSDVVDRINKGLPLPEKTIVLCFDPGYRLTEQLFSPILAARNVPATWLTDADAIDRRDKKYVSPHQEQVMKSSGHWDVFSYRSSKPFSVQIADAHKPAVFNAIGWEPRVGRFALNRVGNLSYLSRLNVNNHWTPEDLVHRLMVELPLNSPAYLSLQQIQGRNWGINVDYKAARERRFSLHSGTDKRSGSLYWLGTQGLKDLQIRFEVRRLSGEMLFLLRSDQDAGEYVGVRFSNGRVSVEQQSSGATTRLASSACPDLIPGTPFNAVFAVRGRQLAVAVNEHPLIALDSLRPSASTQGMVRLVIQNSIKGVAEAQSVKILCTPLTN